MLERLEVAPPDEEENEKPTSRSGARNGMRRVRRRRAVKTMKIRSFDSTSKRALPQNYYKSRFVLPQFQNEYE